MKKMWKRYLAWLTVCVMMVALVPAALAEGGASMEGKIILPFWHSTDEQAVQAWWDKYVALFNEQSDTIYVDMQAVPSDAYDAKLKAAQATGTAPQLLYVSYTDCLAKSVTGLYMPLDDLIDPAVWDDVYDSVEDMCGVGGVHYLLPLQTEPYSMLFYRKDMFEAAGLDPNAPPTSWEQLIEYAKKLTTPEHFGLAISGEGDNGWVNWGWEAMFGKNLLNDDWSGTNVRDPEFTNLINLYKTLLDDESIPAQPMNAFWNIQPLCEGRVAMQFNGSWAITSIMTDYASVCDPANIGLCPAPTPDGIVDGVTTVATGGYGMAIDANAANPEACIEFLNWLLMGDPNIMADFFEAVSYSKFSGRASVDAEIAKRDTASINPWLDIITTKISPFAKPEPIYPWDVSAAYATAMANVMYGGYKVEDAIDECASEIEYIIDSMGLAGTNPKQAK